MLTLINPTITSLIATESINTKEPYDVLISLRTALINHEPGLMYYSDPGNPEVVEIYSGSVSAGKQLHVASIKVMPSGRAVQVLTTNVAGKNVFAALQKSGHVLRVNKISVNVEVEGSSQETARASIQEIADYYNDSGRPITVRKFPNNGYHFYRHNFNYMWLAAYVQSGVLNLQATVTPPDPSVMTKLYKLPVEQILEEIHDFRAFSNLPAKHTLVPSLRTAPAVELHPIVHMVRSYMPYLKAIERKHGDMASTVLGETIMAVMDAIDNGVAETDIQAMFLQLTK